VSAPVALEPLRGRFFSDEVARLGGIELLRSMMEHGIPDPPLTRLTGLRVTEVGLGAATMAMPATRWWQSAATGVFLAGAIAFVADGALGAAIMTAAPAGFGMSSAELSLDFVRAATMHSVTVIGRGRLLHSTRSQGISEVHVEDGSGRLLAHGTSRGMLVELPGSATLATSDDPAEASPPVEDGSPDPYRREAVGDVLDQAFWDTHSGMDFARGFVAGDYLPPVCHLTGVRWVACDEGTATCTMPRSPWLCNGFGVLYGGAIAMLADFAQNSALLTRLPPATAFAPLDFKVNFLRPVLPSDGVVVARAGVVHLGRTIAVTTCDVLDEAGKRVAVANETMVVLPQRPWERPVPVAEEQLAGWETDP
jgi:uncharacterized protein (TIGR00369 family)